MNTTATNNYSGINLESLNKSELSNLKRSLECDISWTEHHLKSVMATDKSDLLLDQLQIYKKLYHQVIKLS
jgi:hypothetical protein